jgi:hypothetical protein
MVSAQGRLILQTLTAADGRALVVDLRRRIGGVNAASASTRASLSRSLRRLWRAGLVELVDDRQCTLTDEVRARQRNFETVRAKPDTCYRAYVAKRQRCGEPIEFGSASKFVEGWRQAAASLPVVRVHEVQLTAYGREAVNNEMSQPAEEC